MNTNTPRQSTKPDSSSGDELVAARRRAILRGLGKGGAALAVLSPVASHATRSFKLSNPSVTGGFGYCSVSGFQSAVVSGSPDTIPQCAAFAPSFFATVTPLVYSDLTAPDTVNTNRLRMALNARYSLTGGNRVTNEQLNATLRATLPQPLAIPAARVVIVPVSASEGTEIKATTEFPTTLNATGPFNGAGLFTASADARTLLEVLRDGIGASPTSANCYFLSTFLTVERTGATLPGSVDKTYILAQYDTTAFTVSTPEGKFFKALANRTS